MKKKSLEPTLTDVAAQAGVSIATISRVLNDSAKVRPATVERVRAAMDALGYPYEAAAARNPLVLAVLPSLDNPFYAKIIKGIQASGRGYGFEVFVYPEDDPDANCAKLLRLIQMTNAGGLILLSPVNNPATLDELGQAVQLVQCAEYNERSPHSYVGVDDQAAARNAVETLLQKGHRRIAFINGPAKYRYARQRALGYAAALKQAGLSVAPSLMFHVSERSLDPSLAIARQLLVSRERPDAILAASDLIAAAVMKAAAQEGVSVPRELAVIGFDNTFVALVSHPSATAVNMPQYQLGCTACEILAERMQNPSAEPRQLLLPTELIMRESV